MTWYIIGMTFGSIIMAIGFSIAIYFSVKNHTFNKLVKTVSQKAEDKINDDIRVWAKQTNNKIITSSLFKYGQYGTRNFFMVDSILITNKVVVVIEIKSISGGIVGDANDKVWYKKVGEKKSPFANPIIKNDENIKHISKMLNQKLPTISLTIFSNRAEYIKVKNSPSHVGIIREIDLFKTLDSINSNLEVKLNSEKVKKIHKLCKSFVTKKQKHIDLYEQSIEKVVK